MRRLTFLAVVCLALGFLAHPAAAEKPPENAARSADLEALHQKAAALYAAYPEDPEALDRGIEVYRKILERTPRDAEARWRIAENLGMKTEFVTDKKARRALFEQILEEAEKAVDLDKDSSPAHFYVGIAQAGLAETSGTFSALKQVKGAKKSLAKARELDPEGPFGVLARVVLAAISSESPWPLKDLDEADRLTGEAVDLDPNLTYAWLERARVLEKMGKNTQAVEALEACLAVETPTYPPDARALDWPRARELKERLLAGENP